MQYRVKHAVIVWIVISILALPLGATAWARNPFEAQKDTTAGFMILDLFLIRPVSLGATILGSAAFVVALPFTAPAGETGYSLEKLIKEPAQYTFSRSLGFF